MSLKQWDGILKKLKFFFLIISSLMNSIRKNVSVLMMRNHTGKNMTRLKKMLRTK